MTNDQKPLIEIRNITKSFETSAGKVTILKQANFSIKKGSFTIIYGTSGSGKSTLLNILMGLEPPSTGQVLFDGADMYQQSPDDLAHFRAQTRGIVQQTNYWVKSLTVIENVSLPLYFSGLPKAKAEATAMDCIKLVGMEKHIHHLPYVLSGGEQQRVAMARALAANPSYLLADEPTGNLDSTNGDLIINLLRTFNRESQRTIILVTHNLEYLPIGTQLLLIKDGFVTESTGSDNKQYTDQLMDQMKQRITRWSDSSSERTRNV